MPVAAREPGNVGRSADCAGRQRVFSRGVEVQLSTSAKDIGRGANSRKRRVWAGTGRGASRCRPTQRRDVVPVREPSLPGARDASSTPRTTRAVVKIPQVSPPGLVHSEKSSERMPKTDHAAVFGEPPAALAFPLEAEHRLLAPPAREQHERDQHDTADAAQQLLLVHRLRVVPGEVRPGRGLRGQCRHRLRCGSRDLMRGDEPGGVGGSCSFLPPQNCADG